ncbi:endonuclease/exonuclease/phosphatase family protein [Candidatus Kaiserbacteria bacterium]|nr:endonuclease/exonuclease/phosphatase family protein [Candidatus Kaiserbacteria bacterium]USN92373.1 MAG: endonuclease/exonuclease/phosphatase family protein [Candidatus Nomurabacteria bacterium]
MKIVVLNIWGGRMSKDLLVFLEKLRETEVFLLQEVMHQATSVTCWEPDEEKEIFSAIDNVLDLHRGYFAPAVFDEWGLAMFIKKDIQVNEIGDIFVHNHRESMVGRDATTVGRNIQYATILHDQKPLTMINFHGLWNGEGKSDSDDRIKQSKRIIDFIKNIPHDIVLGGDFNLLPGTQSLQMIENDLGLKNLITEHEITSTRTSLYDKPIGFADYVFISQGIEVKDFQVLPDEVSDHSPLLLEI